MKRWRNQAPLGSQVRMDIHRTAQTSRSKGRGLCPYALCLGAGGSWGPRALPWVAPCRWLCCLQKQQLGWGQGGARGGVFVAGYPC